jgi:cysteine dioxygenase
MSVTLNNLFDYLDGLKNRAALAELTARLAQANFDLAELAPFMRYSPKTYSRNLVRAGPLYNLLVLCWKNGQRSPIHDHRGSSCAVRVLDGMMTETIFEFAPNGHIKPILSRDVAPGVTIGSQDTDIHQVSNLQASGKNLVTLHIYSPPLMVMGTYNLTDTVRGEELMFEEFHDAAGI